MSRRVHVVVPAGVRDAARPSGGNAYDTRVCAGLAGRGWSVLEHELVGGWPHPDRAALTRLARMLGSVPDGDAVLVDGLVGSTAPEELWAGADRLRLGVLVHMPLGHALTGEAGVSGREEQALAAAGVVVVTSAWTRGWLLDAYRLDPARVRTAVPGTDPAPLSPRSDDGRRMLTVGPVSHGKGHDTLMAAASRLGDVDWRLDCAGTLTVDPGTAGDVGRWAAQSGGRVRLTGPLSGRELEAAYAAADLLVHPSRSETYGMVVTEALARGIPVVASDVGGTREALGMAGRLGIPGLLVRPGDADALAGALRRWFTDEELRQRLRAAAAERRHLLPHWDATVAAVHDALVATRLTGARP